MGMFNPILTLVYNMIILTEGEYMKSTFVMLKPDALARNLVDVIITAFVEAGFTIARRQSLVVDEHLILHHYAEVIERVQLPYFKENIIQSFVGKTVVLLEVMKDDHVVDAVRVFIGKTNPAQADPKSIRGKYGDDDLEVAIKEGRLVRNLVHASDSDASAMKELALWFKD